MKGPSEASDADKIQEPRAHAAPVTLSSVDIDRWVGREVAVSPWRAVTQPMIDTFAEVIDDAQWIHVDVARARAESAYGGTIAHGFLTLALFTALLESCVATDGWRTGINYGFDRLRFTGPVPAGARVRGRFTLHAIDRLPAKGAQTEGVQLHWDVIVEVEGAEQPAIVARWLTRRHV